MICYRDMTFCWFKDCAEFGPCFRSLTDEVQERADPICDAAHKAHKAATAKRAQYLDPLEKASRDVKALMSAYDAASAAYDGKMRLKILNYGLRLIGVSAAKKAVKEE